MYRIIYIYVWFSIFNIWLKACFTLAGETAGESYIAGDYDLS